MDARIRSVLVIGGGSALVAGFLATPQVLASVEPVTRISTSTTMNDIFPPAALDASKLKKYDIRVANTVSSEPTHQDVITKIGFGVKSEVTVVSTASGTYSSDGLFSPSVRYPGIDVLEKEDSRDDWHSTWVVTPGGTIHWTVQNAGSFTFVRIDR